MKTKAFQIGNRVHTPANKTGIIQDAGLRPEGTGGQSFKYWVESATDEYFAGWQLEHA